MAYVTGSAGNVTALRDAVVAAAIGNGWAWDSGANILSKGNVLGQITISGNRLMVQAGIGSPSGVLTNPSGQLVGVSDVLSGTPNIALSYPLTYHIFINTTPDEIVVAVNYQTSWWQWLGFGIATPLGQPDTPVWQWGTCNNLQIANDAGSLYNGVGVTVDVNLTPTTSPRHTGAVPFWNPQHFQCAYPTYSIYGNVDGQGWLHGGQPNAAGKSSATEIASGLLKTQPNTWNGESVLCRLQIATARASDFRSYVGEIGHLRLTRNDNFSDGQILTLGADSWFIAPAYRKDTVNRDGTSYGDPNNRMTHSGTVAVAVRKT